MSSDPTATSALSERLTKSLSFAGLTPQQLADELAITPQTVRAWLAGTAAPRLPHLMVWALRCGVPFEWLTGTEDADRV